MSNEIQVTCGLSIRKSPLVYQPAVTTFKADYVSTNPNGPTPGAVTIGVQHTNISLAQLTALGGWCRFTNLDPTNFVIIGINLGTTAFYPIHELLPGEQYIARLSRYLGQELKTGTGTGIVAGTVTLALKADVAPCVVLIEAFDK